MTDLAALLGDTETEELRDAIIDRAAEKVVKRWSAPVDEEGKRRFDDDLHRRVQERFDDLLTANLEPQVLAVIDAGLCEDYQPTSEYGEPKGAKQTIREAIMAKVEKELRLGDNRSGYSSRNDNSALSEFIGREVKEVVRKELWEKFHEIADATTKAAAEAIHDTMDGIVKRKVQRR